MRYFAALALMMSLTACATDNLPWAGSPNLVPKPPAWSASDQTCLADALTAMEAGTPMTPLQTQCTIRAVTEYGALREANREARATLN